MSESVTIDDIYHLFRASQEEFERRLLAQEQKEAEAKMAELKRTSRAVDRLYAYRQGLFVIKTAGNMVKIVNSDNFQPKIW